MESRDQELVDLLALCALRDQSALKKLYERVAPFLNGVAYRILRSDECSNEVLQEAFVQIWNNANSYQAHKAKPLTWMCSIVRYRAIDKLNAEKRHLNRVDEAREQSVIDSLESPAAPEQEYAHSQMQSHIHECLEKMNEKLKLCIELAYLHGYSREELASTFDAKINTVKSWLHRGSERLKQCLSTKIQTPA